MQFATKTSCSCNWRVVETATKWWPPHTSLLTFTVLGWKQGLWLGKLRDKHFWMRFTKRFWDIHAFFRPFLFFSSIFKLFGKFPRVGQPAANRSRQGRIYVYLAYGSRLPRSTVCGCRYGTAGAWRGNARNLKQTTADWNVCAARNPEGHWAGCVRVCGQSYNACTQAHCNFCAAWTLHFRARAWRQGLRMFVRCERQMLIIRKCCG